MVSNEGELAVREPKFLGYKESDHITDSTGYVY